MSIGREIRDKIRSVQNTKKITTAMQMVAASKLRRTQERMQAAKPYAEKIRQVISHVALSHSEYRHPFMESRAVKRVGYIVITTDRGLCGGLNSNLLKATIKSMKEQIDQGIEVDIAVLGGKGMAFFKRMGGNVVAHAKDLGDHPDLLDMIGPVKIMLDAYLENRIDLLFICHNDFVSTLRQEPTVTQLLPLVEAEESSIKHHWDYIYEPDDAHYVLENLLTRYIEAQVYRAGTENIACEMAARMTAMRAAGDNASELISGLKLAYNKARQAGITRELSEIVAGASVL